MKVKFRNFFRGNSTFQRLFCSYFGHMTFTHLKKKMYTYKLQINIRDRGYSILCNTGNLTPSHTRVILHSSGSYTLSYTLYHWRRSTVRKNKQLETNKQLQTNQQIETNTQLQQPYLSPVVIDVWILRVVFDGRCEVLQCLHLLAVLHLQTAALDKCIRAHLYMRKRGKLGFRYI